MRLMINRIVDRCHVGESLETVIRYVISRLAGKFTGFREMSTPAQAWFIKTIILRHNDNRDLYHRVVTGRF